MVKSELAILTGIAKAAVEPLADLKWNEWTADYSLVRDLIEHTYPDDFRNHNARMNAAGGFYRGKVAHERIWKTPGGNAIFTSPEQLNSLGFQDAPGRKQPPKQLLQDDISFRQIAETVNDIVIVITPELALPGPAIVYVNPAFTRISGYSAEETLGRPLRISQGHESCRVKLDKIKATLHAGGHVHGKVLNYAKGGAPNWLDLQIVPLLDDFGTITHFAAY